MKRKLGRGHRSLVQRARTLTKGEFFRQLADAPADYARKQANLRAGQHPWANQITVQPDSEHVIRQRLQMTPGEFWQHANGKPLPLERMIEPEQLERF